MFDAIYLHIPTNLFNILFLSVFIIAVFAFFSSSRFETIHGFDALHRSCHWQNSQHHGSMTEAHKNQKILNSVITRTTMVIFWTTERNGRYPFLCEHFIISVVLFHLWRKRGNRSYDFMDYFSQSKFSSFNTESCWQLSKNDYWLKLRYAKEMSKNFNFKYLFLNPDELEIVPQCGWICLPVQQRWTGTI